MPLSTEDPTVVEVDHPIAIEIRILVVVRDRISQDLEVIDVHKLIAGQIRIDAREKEPRIAVKNDLAGVQIGPLLADLANTAALAGEGTVKVDLTMRGLEPSRIKPSLRSDSSSVRVCRPRQI